MATDLKISQMTQQATLLATNELPINDPTDLTMAPSGTNKTMTLGQVAGYLGTNPYIVGLTTATAPYTSIQAAIDAAALVATPTSRQIVYIQPGQYVQSFVMKPYVDVYGAVESQYAQFFPTQIVGSIQNDASQASICSIRGIEIISNGPQECIYVTGLSPFVLNITNCSLIGVTKDVVFCAPGVTFTMNMEGGLITADPGNKIFNLNSGTVTLSNVAQYASGTVSTLTDCTLYNLHSSSNSDSYSLTNSSLIMLYNLCLTAGTAPLAYLNDATSFIGSGYNNIVCNSVSGYVFDGAIAGGIVNVAYNVYAGTATGINPILGTSSFSNPNEPVTTAQRLAMTGMKPGLPVFDTTLGIIFYWNGVAWVDSSQTLVPDNNCVAVATVGPVTLVSQTSYVSNNASNTSFVLPGTSAVGDVFEITLGIGAGGFSITQGASQQIVNATTVTTVGVTGSVSTIGINGSIKIKCLVPNTIWAVISIVGNFNFN
jgi:hypothetical protein